MSGSNYSLYAARLTDAAVAVSSIPDRSRIVMGLGVSQPPALLEALSVRAQAGGITGARLYYLLATSIAGATVLSHELRPHFRPMSLFHSAVERALDANPQNNSPVDFLPTSFSDAPRLLCEHVGVDTLVTTVSPIDTDGYFSLGTNTDYALAVARRAKRIIVEVNPAMPRVYGNCTIHVSQVTTIVENAVPLIEIPAVPPRPEDLAIGEIIAGLARDGDCLQMGIGALPDAVCVALRNHRGLGIHSELMTPGLAELMRIGAVDNSRKTLHRGRGVFTFAMGDEALYDFLHENRNLEAHPVDYVNAHSVIAANTNMLSVNATLQVDLDGACNSEGFGRRQYSAAGGQLDFVRGAYASPEGRSIIACHSTAAGGNVSRIVAALDGPVTTPRNDTHIVVTEYGWADLKGRSLVERAKLLIALAHPRFRENLEREASVRYGKLQT